MTPIQGVVERQDLLALPTNPRGYIGDKVLPTLRVRHKVGDRYMTAVSTSDAAQTGRSPAGSITASTTINSNPVSYTCAEVIKRTVMGDEERNEFGTEDEYLATLAWNATKCVRDANESKIATLTANANSPTDITSDIFYGIKQKVDLLSAYGMVGIAGNSVALDVVRQNPTVTDRMKATGSILAPVVDVRSISGAMLAAIFGASEVHEAKTDTAIWSTHRVYVYVIADPSVDPMANPQLGRFLSYGFPNVEGPNQDLACRLQWLPTVNANVLDVVSYNVGKIANSIFGYHLSIDGS